MMSTHVPRIRVRKATLRDARFLYRLRNDAEVRRQFIHHDRVAYPEHVRWLTAVRKNPERLLLVGCDAAGRPLGQLRFDREGLGMVDISISIAPSHRGQGFAVPFLTKGIAMLATYAAFPRRVVLRAKIKRENTASIRAFERAGFVRYAGSAAYVFLRKKDRG